jgi:ribosome maturation factor RimP
MGPQETSRDAIIARVTEIAGRVGRSEGIEIVDVELKGGGRQRLLRIFIDKAGGVTHADCEFISKQIGTILDVEDVVPGASYTLEVSSPGVERRLKKPEDFTRFLGHKAKVVLREPVAARRQWEGTLSGFSGGVIRLQPAAGEAIEFQLAQVERANLKFDW